MSGLNKLPNPPKRIFYFTKLFSHATTESNDDLLEISWLGECHTLT